MRWKITPAQCRAGRAMLDWTQDQLAQKIPCARATLQTFEAGLTDMQPIRHRMVIELFEKAGVTLIGDSGVNRKS